MAGLENKDADFVALSAAALAAIIAIFVTEGPFTPLEGLITLPLLLVAYHFGKGRHDTKGKSLAFAAIIALICIPLAGYLFEAFTFWRWDTDSKDLHHIKRSQVPEWWIVAAWLVITLAAYLHNESADHGRS